LLALVTTQPTKTFLPYLADEITLKFKSKMGTEVAKFNGNYFNTYLTAAKILYAESQEAVLLICFKHGGVGMRPANLISVKN
jgi:hypothetical protein